MTHRCAMVCGQPGKGNASHWVETGDTHNSELHHTVKNPMESKSPMRLMHR